MTHTPLASITRTCVSVGGAALGLCLSLGLPGGARADDAKPLPPDQAEFFETKVRPVLVEHCYACHSEKKVKGGLRLDTRDMVLKGGDGGPVLVPGKPEASRLVKAVGYADPDLQMPPKGKLSPEQVAALTEWVTRGAPDARAADGTTDLVEIDQLMRNARGHWAFQPVKEPAAPAVAGATRVVNPIDAFLLARLEAAGLTFASPADKRTLIRRATVDLHGVPPTPEEAAAFEADPSPKAYEDLLDRLLASPRYGERWGRHWMDVARYADTKGGISTHPDRFPDAWTYRDYVIKAFNDDTPFDRFLVEQLAADLLPPTPGDNRVLAALGFLTVGRLPDNVLDDFAIEDRIDLISRGLLGLTVSCARCHDHKLEPIPTKDYYALYGVFKSCKLPRTNPALEPQPHNPDHHAYVAEYEKTRRAMVEIHARLAAATLGEIRGRVGDYLLAVQTTGGADTSDDPKAKAAVAEMKLHESIHNDVATKWDEWVEKHPEVFGPWVAFTKLKADDFAAQSGPLAEAFAANADRALNPLVARAFAGRPPASLEDVAVQYNALFAGVNTAWRRKAADALSNAGRLDPADDKSTPAQLGVNAIGRVYQADQAVTLGDGDDEKLRQVLVGKGSPFAPPPGQFVSAKLFPPQALAEVTKVAQAATALGTHPGATPARAMVIQEDKPFNAKVFVRGNPRTLGADAPRAFFTALTRPDDPPFPKDTSGRLELANAITSPGNPLTARVFVNRVWLWHFGRAIVGTPSDFGFRGDKPTHPELLDYLAARFVADGWGIKRLHKLVMLSAAYRQSSRPADAVAAGVDPRAADPENKLYWRANPRQLEFEAYRDSIMAVAGQVDPALGGPPVDVVKTATRRRTVYALIDRKMLPGLFRSFNLPDPNFSAGGRTHTIPSPQALFLLNSPFVLENAKALAAAVKPADAGGRADAVHKLYRAAFQRDPSPAELERALAFLDAYPANDVVLPEATAWSYGFADYDEKAKTVSGFTPLRFAGNVVKGGKVGDVDVTGLEITAEGGTARVKAAVRRWTAPEDGAIDVAAELSHAAPTGGVVCFVVSSRHGLLAEWSAANGSLPTGLKQVELKSGDTLDFVTVARGDPGRATYQWAPTITMPGRAMPGVPGMTMKWDAKTHFRDATKLPVPLGPWEELAQVLLLSNEFAIAE